MEEARAVRALSAAMLIELEHANLRDDLAAFLRRCGCMVATASHTELEVDAPAAITPDALRGPEVEIGAYLRAWAELNAVTTPRLRSG
jgi:hypothetical protein